MDEKATPGSTVISIPVPKVPSKEKLSPFRSGLRWMPRRAPTIGCPVGIEYLLSLEEVSIERITNQDDLDATEKGVSIPKWYVKNVDGEVVFRVLEESKGEQNKLGKSRGYYLHFMDGNGKECMLVKKETDSCGDKNRCGCAEMQVEAPLGTTIGSVTNDCSFCSPSFTVLNYESDFAIMIEGPCKYDCCKCCCPKEFSIRNDEGENIGTVVSSYRDTVGTKEFSAIDSFKLEFKNDAEIRVKAATLGAIFLLDILFFHDNN